MSDKDNGGPAFPVIKTDIQWLGDHGEDGAVSIVRSVGGATLRDYFAARALPEVIRRYPISADTTIPEAAEMAYQMADAMLKEREK